MDKSSTSDQMPTVLPKAAENLEVIHDCVLLFLCVAAVVGVVVVVVVVEWLHYSKRIIIVRWADLSEVVFR